MNIKQWIVKRYQDIRLWHYISLLCLISIVLMSIHKKPIRYISTSEFLIPKNGPEQIAPQIALELEDVAVLETVTWNKFKTELSNNEEVLEYIYKRIDIPNASQMAKDHLANMNEDQWNKFVESLSIKNANIVKKTPFAFFAIYINNNKIDDYKNQIYCKNSVFFVPKNVSSNIPAAFVTLEILHIYDTYDLPSGDRETVVLKILEIKENIKVVDKQEIS